MKKILLLHLTKYLPFILVTSFFKFHNIILVLIGIGLALFQLNKNSIINYLKSNENKKFDNKEFKDNSLIKNDYNLINPNNEDSNINLAETIEELGFIPSTNKKNDSQAA